MRSWAFSILLLLVACGGGDDPAGSAGAIGSDAEKVGWTALFLVVMAFPVRYALRWIGSYHDRVGRLTPNVQASAGRCAPR